MTRSELDKIVEYSLFLISIFEWIRDMYGARTLSFTTYWYEPITVNVIAITENEYRITVTGSSIYFEGVEINGGFEIVKIDVSAINVISGSLESAISYTRDIVEVVEVGGDG